VVYGARAVRGRRRVVGAEAWLGGRRPVVARLCVAPDGIPPGVVGYQQPKQRSAAPYERCVEARGAGSERQAKNTSGMPGAERWKITVRKRKSQGGAGGTMRRGRESEFSSGT